LKRQELLDVLAALPTAELASLAGVGLSRGRPSNALRQSLTDEVLSAIREKRVVVRRDGTIHRG
jgi:hypothetical protein